MSGDPPSQPPSSSSWEGQEFRPSNFSETCEAINRAFDYRGDVTIRLKSGEEVEGYIFDRKEKTLEPSVRLYVAHDDQPRTVPYKEIQAIVFSGEDTAFGRSWEDWLQKWKKSTSKQDP